MKKSAKQWAPKTDKPTFDRDRALSWSAISAFQWNKQQWYDKYVLGILSEKTPELEFGSLIDQRVQDEPDFLPNLVRYPIMQHKMQAELNGIKLLGIADTYRAEIPYDYHAFETGLYSMEEMEAVVCKPALRDYKTGRKAWDQKRANETGQLTMYALLLWLTEKIRPEEVDFYIDWMPTHYVDKEIQFIKEGDIRTFHTKRTMHDILEFGQKIQDTYREMIEYAEKRPLLDTHSYEDFFAPIV